MRRMTRIIRVIRPIRVIRVQFCSITYYASLRKYSELICMAMTTKKIEDHHDDTKPKNPEEQRLLDDELRAAKNMNWYRRLQIIKLSA